MEERASWAKGIRYNSNVLEGTRNTKLSLLSYLDDSPDYNCL